MNKEHLCIETVPMDLAWNDPEENLRRVERAIKERLSKSGAAPESKIFLFPELTLTGFVTQKPAGWPIDPPGPHLEAVQRLAARYKTALALGFPEANLRDPSRPYNNFSLINPQGEIVASYRKMHLFTAGKHPESAVYQAGKNAATCVYRGWKIGFAVCFDLRFPSFFAEYAKAGTNLLLIGSCWIGGPHKSEQYRTLNSAYAILTQGFVATVNRSGRDPFFEYDGSAYVFSPFGDDISHCGAGRLDPKALDDCRRMAVRTADRSSYPVKSL